MTITTVGQAGGAAETPSKRAERVFDGLLSIHGFDPGTAMVHLAGSPPVPIGTGVRLELRMPSGVWIDVCGSVVRAPTAGAADARQESYGIHFAELIPESTQLLASCMVGGSRLGDSALPARIYERYRVELVARSLLFLTLWGDLSAEEAASLERQLLEQLDEAHPDAMCVYINMQHFAGASGAALSHLQSALAAIGRHNLRLGVLLAPSAPIPEIHRIIRQAGVANELVCFEDPAEAGLFWAGLERDIATL